MISWKYLDAEVYPQYNGIENVISKVSWICELNQNGQVVLSEGSTGLDVDNLDQNNYILLENVTQEILDSWVKNKMGLEDVEKIENALFEKLEDITNPKIVKVNFNFENTVTVSPDVIIDTSNDDPNYSDRELNALGIGTA